jgi:hypothetical protein
MLMLLTSTSSLHHSVVPPIARGECYCPLPLGLLLSLAAPDFGGLPPLGGCGRGTAPGLPLDLTAWARHGCPSQGATRQNSSIENNLERCSIILSIAYGAIYNLLEPSPQYSWGGLLPAAKISSLLVDIKEQIMNLSINIKYMILRNQKRLIATITRWIQVEFSHWRSCWSYYFFLAASCTCLHYCLLPPLDNLMHKS